MESDDFETESLFKYQAYFTDGSLLVIFTFTESVPQKNVLAELIMGFGQSYNLKTIKFVFN